MRCVKESYNLFFRIAILSVKDNHIKESPKLPIYSKGYSDTLKIVILGNTINVLQTLK